ncbi:MAG: diguanylate cyclase [Ghiorsea sp.]
MIKDTILIAEDAHFMVSVLKKRLQKEFSFKIICVDTMAEAINTADTLGERIFVSILSLTLPDAPDGEVVDAMVARGVPSIVFSGRFEADIRDRMLQKRVVDYIPKEGDSSLNYLFSLLHRISSNKNMTALIVDDSTTSQKHFSIILSQMMISCVAVNSAAEALKLIAEEPERFKLLLVDFHMPETNGLELIHALHKVTNVDNLAIIGISGVNNHFLTAHFLKAGASDFLYKSSSYEEFVCRISLALNKLDQIALLESAATTDFLTKLNNRRSLFEVGKILWGHAKREHASHFSVCMLDIDHFKQINDTHGHDAGDIVLREIANVIKQSFRDSDLVVRYGGEEFCIVLQQVSPKDTTELMNQLRLKIEQMEISVLHEQLKVTVSIGICHELHGSLEEMISAADHSLYQAKAQGRNQVCTL